MTSDTIAKIGIFATIVGCVRVVQALSGIWIFTYVTNAFMISPAPSPFQRAYVPGFRNLNDGFVFGCESPDGQIKWEKWDYEMRCRIPGPHRRGVSFLFYFNPLANIKDARALDRPEVLTRYYFCNNGPLAQAAQCGPNLKSVIFRGFPVAGGPPFEVRTSCSP